MREFDDVDEIVCGFALPFNYLFKVEDNRWYYIMEEADFNLSLYDLDEAIKEYK